MKLINLDMLSKKIGITKELSKIELLEIVKSEYEEYRDFKVKPQWRHNFFYFDTDVVIDIRDYVIFNRRERKVLGKELYKS